MTWNGELSHINREAEHERKEAIKRSHEYDDEQDRGKVSDYFIIFICSNSVWEFFSLEKISSMVSPIFVYKSAWNSIIIEFLMI